MIRNTRTATLIAVTTGALLLAACGGGGGSAEPPAASASSGPATGDVEVFSWWTSGSENAALEQLFGATKAANPGINLINAAVAGGAGTNAQQVLATRLSGGDIPGTWQTHAGGALGDYVTQGVIDDLTPLYTKNGWDKVLPKAILDSLTYDGKIYAVPTGVHRGNVVWTNTALLAKAGVTVGDGVTWDQLKVGAEALQAKGIVPLCLGDKDIWTAATLLESIIVGEVGPDSWTKLLSGDLAWGDPAVATAVGHFNEALTWTNKDHKALDWTGAVTALADGKCAMNVMGDWEYGELLVKHNLVDGTDFSSTVIGDPNDFVTVTDVFVEGDGSKNPAGALAWLTAIMTPDAQLKFNAKKGSAPVRTDVPVTTLGAYQQAAVKTLTSGVLVPSLIQNQANIPASIGQAFSDSTTLLEANGDTGAFGKAMDAAVASGS